MGLFVFLLLDFNSGLFMLFSVLFFCGNRYFIIQKLWLVGFTRSQFLGLKMQIRICLNMNFVSSFGVPFFMCLSFLASRSGIGFYLVQLM